LDALKRGLFCWAWWCTPVIPALRRQRQDEFKASLDSVSKKKKEEKVYLKVGKYDSFIY
jgi:hypothetical protein